MHRLRTIAAGLTRPAYSTAFAASAERAGLFSDVDGRSPLAPEADIRSDEGSPGLTVAQTAMADPRRFNLPERYAVVLRALLDACRAEQRESVPARPVAEWADITVHSAMGRLVALREGDYVSSRPRGRAGPTRWAPTAKARTCLGSEHASHTRTSRGADRRQRRPAHDLGTHTIGKGCLYVKKLSEVDLAVLEQLARRAV
jgi:hypothetical protein